MSSLYSPDVATAAIVTIGNELLSGDVANTNGSWLAGRLEAVGVQVRLLAVLPDEIDTVAAFLRAHGPTVDVVIVTGGLGGTPDDVTREAMAAAFGVEQVEFPAVADALRARFTRDPDYVTPWAWLPEGSRPLENPLGGAPGFHVGNAYVLPGLPSEMEAMYELVEAELAGAAPIATWRRTYATTESRIVRVLVELETRHPGVRVGSYPTFGPEGSTVEVVLKSADPEDLAVASAWAETALAAATR
jgi:molybdenum cofactor synthesis domain-containing protein